MASESESSATRSAKKLAGGRPRTNPAWEFFSFKNVGASGESSDGEDLVDADVDIYSIATSKLQAGSVMGYCKVPGCRQKMDVSNYFRLYGKKTLQ